jgi:hypothetical protein
MFDPLYLIEYRLGELVVMGRKPVDLLDVEDSVTETELSVLFNNVSSDLGRTDPGSPERRNCLASLENIERKVIQRRSAPKPSF